MEAKGNMHMHTAYHHTCLFKTITIMAVKQLKGRFNIKNVKMVQHRRFQFFRFHTNMLTFKSTEISHNK